MLVSFHDFCCLFILKLGQHLPLYFSPTAPQPSLPPDKIWIIPQAVAVDPNLDFDVLSYLNAKDTAHLDNRAHGSNHDTTTLHHENHGGEESIQSAGKNESTRLEECGALGRVCTTENVPPRQGNGVTARNESTNTRTNGIPCKPQREGLSGPVELPALFQPLVLMVAGLRPVKVSSVGVRNEWD